MILGTRSKSRTQSLDTFSPSLSTCLSYVHRFTFGYAHLKIVIDAKKDLTATLLRGSSMYLEKNLDILKSFCKFFRTTPLLYYYVLRKLLMTFIRHCNLHELLIYDELLY